MHLLGDYFYLQINDQHHTLATQIIRRIRSMLVVWSFKGKTLARHYIHTKLRPTVPRCDYSCIERLFVILYAHSTSNEMFQSPVGLVTRHLAAHTCSLDVYKQRSHVLLGVKTHHPLY